MLATDHDGIRRWLDAGVGFAIAGADIFYLANGSEAARSTFEEAVTDDDSSQSRHQ